MNKENCALKLVDEIILYYDARSKKHQNKLLRLRISCVNAAQFMHVFTFPPRVKAEEILRSELHRTKN